MKWSFQSIEANGAYEVRHDMLRYLEARAAEGSDLPAALLIFGELVANVVRHAPGPIAVDLFWEDGYGVLRVVDSGPGFDWNGRAELPESLAESGRGLYIVHAVAAKFRVRKLPGGGTEATAWLPVSLKTQVRSA
jgi:anti-sigma regulatory factor (Ser/Thr protein kinase)